ncbi:phosphatidylinositol-4-phosphate 5-kinase domain-containing protein [Neurospora intermedia]|uniref:Phosphatidylinositol-4-phosphate 5-kinase domain-containing protein n=1 Tax=Neurospora intermedia TaxID=5142 RepID=A0ABR3DK04_NEUIN
MQSGISASKELVSQFNDLLGSPSTFGLLINIANEQLQPIQTLTSSPGSSFASNVDTLLTPHIKEKEALYIILRRYDSSPALVAVTYVPDTAPVRQKMLFASTRLTLVRELGSEHFRETIFATNAKELTSQGFEKHDAHTALDAPLTEEEKSLGEVKRAEQEAGAGTSKREIHLGTHMAMPMGEDALAALKGLAEEGGEGLVMLKVNPTTETIELVPPSSSSSNPSSIADLVQAISPSEPRFTFFRYTHTHNGSEESPILFFYTNPSSNGGRVAIKQRMLYPLMKRAVLEVASREGLNVDKKFEVEEPSEITEDGVLGELHPKAVQSRGFARPKRPGGRRQQQSPSPDPVTILPTFYSTKDQKYLVKSVPRHSEHSFFRDDLLTPYVEYMATHPRSLLVRICDFLGASGYSIGRILRLAPSHHIVMENIMYGRGRRSDESQKRGGDVDVDVDWEDWDLKPTSYFYPERDIADGALTSEATKSQLADEFHDKIRLNKEQADEFFERLEEDTRLLAEYGAVDYSLFLVRMQTTTSTSTPSGSSPGQEPDAAAASSSSEAVTEAVLEEVAPPTEGPSVPPGPPSWRTGIASADGKYIYRASILDFFWAKHKLQPMVMTVLIKLWNLLISKQGPMSITTTPEEYRQRFLKMCRSYVEVVG